MGICFEVTTDMLLVHRIMTDPVIYPHISDDGSPLIEEFKPNIWLMYVKVWDFTGDLGLFLLVPHNVAMVEVHTCLLPRAWGKKAFEIAREGLLWVWKNTRFHRIITNVPEDNRLAYQYARRAGMTEFGRNPNSFLKHGKLLSQIMLGASRPKEIPCPLP